MVFFNSINGDRKYNAEQMNNPYHRVVSNGVFANADGQSTDLQVLAVEEMNVKVLVGEGIFFDKWVKLDADMPFIVPTAHVTQTRIDSIVVRIDNTEEVRAGSIIYKQGTAANNPTPPALENTLNVKEYRLCNIEVAPTTTTITQANITDTRPTSECGFVSNLLADSDVTALYEQWHAQFDEWFANVKDTLLTSTLIRSYTSSYTTPTQGETEIPIQITQYNQNLDILQVFANGLRLIPEIDYTIDSNEQITLTKDLDIGQQVSFIVYKSVDGSEAESVVDQVHQLQELMITDATGSTKIRVNAGEDVLSKFIAAGRGVHTLYSQTTSLNIPVSGVQFRYFGHLTAQTSGSETGWLYAMGTTGKVYYNYLNGGAWKGWKEITNTNQVTADNGGAKIEVTDNSSVLTAFVNAGVGFHTMYSATGATDTPLNGAFRYFGHITGATTGYIFAISSAGAVFVNYRNGGEWLGWKALYEKNPVPLWEGAYFMNENQTVTPSKPLDQCNHGWVLVWSDYDDATSTKNNYNAVTFVVPKKNASGANWNGSSFMCCLPREVKTDGSFVITAKQVYIYNDKITGFAANNANPANRDVILSAVYEY